MFALTENMRYYLCQHYVDMRKGMTGLYQLIKSDMSLSPVSGDVFVFFSHKRDMVKILRWDTDGFILYQKRLEEVPSKSRVLILLRVLTSFPGRVSF